MNLCYGCMTEKPNNEEACPICGYTSGENHEEHYYLSEGTMVADRYLVGRVLGHGGFGITYLAFDVRLQIKVAIKEYLPSDVATRSEGQNTVITFSGEKREQYDYGKNRFIDEARHLALYNDNPSIVNTTDVFEENNTVYLVMEYLNGIPLSEYLKRKGGRINYTSSLEIMMPIMDALRDVHKIGMIHRDISPDNIYITAKGQVKLLDFGAARFALGEKSKSLSVVLKPGYAPPEQYSSKGKQGTWTDVYSVAATLYRCIEGEKIPEAMDRMMDPDISFSYVNDSNLANVISQALYIRVEDRTQTIEDFQVNLYSHIPTNSNQTQPDKQVKSEASSKTTYNDSPSIVYSDNTSTSTYTRSRNIWSEKYLNNSDYNPIEQTSIGTSNNQEGEIPVHRTSSSYTGPSQQELVRDTTSIVSRRSIWDEKYSNNEPSTQKKQKRNGILPRFKND